MRTIKASTITPRFSALAELAARIRTTSQFLLATLNLSLEIVSKMIHKLDYFTTHTRLRENIK